MPNVNINAGAPGNPLDALIAQHGGDLWGSTGFNIENSLAQSNSGNMGVRGQLGQFGTFGTAYDDSNTFNPNAGGPIDQAGRVMLDGKQYAQLGNTGIGGPGQAIDPSKVTWNDKFGLITDPSNIAKPQDDFMANYAGFIIPALVAGGGLLSAAGSSGGTTAAAVGDISTSDLGALSPAAGGTAFGAGGTTASSGGLLSSLGLGGGTGTGGSFLSTLNTARSGLGLISALTGAGGGSGGGGMGNGALGSIMSLLGLGALGRQGGLFGGGVGTPGGAQAVGDRASAMADPWGTSGLRGQAQGALTPGTMMQLLGLNPGGTASDITKDPAYQFALKEGTNAINAGDAAQGTLRSGNRLAELQNYGTGLAAQYENQYRANNLASLGALSNMAGLGSSSPTAAAASQISAFEGATSLQNSGLNGLFGNLLGGGGQGGGLGGILSGLGNLGTDISNLFGGSGSGGISGWLNDLFGSGTDVGISSDIASGLSDFGWAAGGAL